MCCASSARPYAVLRTSFVTCAPALPAGAAARRCVAHSPVTRARPVRRTGPPSAALGERPLLHAHALHRHCRCNPLALRCVCGCSRARDLRAE
eukprot:4901234-Pleurochrysis_carterae.AAC.2